MVENYSLRPVVEALTDGLLLEFQLLQSVFHPHDRVVEVALVVR